ncbi:MAG: NAD(P)-binding protein, partial [Candidatus Lokiarchaeota archaeon]|nr:NAD(P)-binding protein [Candidatus Lokiarchaeota archaeon]
MTQTENRKFDTIIIGSGLGGLSCAAILAKKGYKVAVFERHYIPGGYCTSFKRKKFVFDASLHQVSGCEPGGLLYNVLEEAGAEKYVEFIKIDPLTKIIAKNYEFEVPQDKDEYIRRLCEKFPEEAKNIRKYFKYNQKIFKFVKKYCNLIGFKKVLYILRHIRKAFQILWLTRKTLQEILDRFIKNKEAQEIISHLWGFLGLAPRNLSYIYFTVGISAYVEEGTFYPKGGSQQISNAFVKAMKENGGKLFLKKEVQEILIEKKKVKGIKLKNGDIYKAPIVVSNADALVTFNKLIDSKHLPNKSRKVNKMTPSLSAVCAYLGLDVDIKDLGIDHFDIVVNKSEDADSYYKEIIDG